MFHVRIFIETSHRGIRPADGWYWSIVEYKTAKGPATVEYKNCVKESTWNKLELIGLAKALKALKRPCETEIFTDNPYLYNAVTKKWVEKWEKSGWKNEKGEQIRHENLWKIILAEMAPHTVEMRLCENHEYKNAMKTELSKMMEGKE